MYRRRRTLLVSAAVVAVVIVILTTANARNIDMSPVAEGNGQQEQDAVISSDNQNQIYVNHDDDGSKTNPKTPEQAESVFEKTMKRKMAHDKQLTAQQAHEFAKKTKDEKRKMRIRAKFDHHSKKLTSALKVKHRKFLKDAHLVQRVNEHKFHKANMENKHHEQLRLDRVKLRESKRQKTMDERFKRYKEGIELSIRRDQEKFRKRHKEKKAKWHKENKKKMKHEKTLKCRDERKGKAFEKKQKEHRHKHHRRMEQYSKRRARKDIQAHH